jgi:DNA-binding SARP family transcriptional activator
VTAYRILGPLSVAGNTVTAGRDRVVLAMLLLHADRVVGAGELIDAVWGEDPPSTARGQLQTCVSRLRRTLPSAVIATDPAGYRLCCGPDDVDAVVFTRLVAAGRERGDARLLREALDLWRGPALVEIDSMVVRRAAVALDEQRADAIEDWAELELAAGHERDLLGELAGLVEQAPLRERLRGQLMVALFRSGRQADALAEYRRAQAVLREELGLDPGHELQEVHRRILAGDQPVAAGRVRCLPRTVGDFTGRKEAVDRLIGVIGEADPHGPAIVVIDGMAGSGKTTLALHVAALVGDRYPDAHLFVDLQGHSAERPAEPAEALLILLRQLGFDAEKIPPAPVDRVAMWRTELAERRALVLFDNAASSGQLADLLPTAPGSLALVTSRRRLAGLDGVHPESLPVLAEPEAVALLARIAGDRVRAEPEAAAQVARRCGGLPLALRLAGARLAHRPRWRVADLVRRLGTAALPELAAEDRSVAGAFALSYGQLAARTQRVFRLLGLYPGTDFDALGVAALAGLPLPEARDALDDLNDVHLVEEPETDVFRMHDLLREFATALAAETGPAERHEARLGVLDQQLHAAIATVRPARRLAALERDIGPAVPLRPDLVVALADPPGRLERERRNLAAYVDAAIAGDLHRYVWQLPRAAWRYLWIEGYGDGVSLMRTALAHADRTGDRWAAGVVTNYLAAALYRRSEIDEACAMLERCIQIRTELGDRVGAATAMGNLGGLHYMAGRWRTGIEVALAAQRHCPRRRGMDESNTRLNTLALCSAQLGQYPEALRYYRLRLMAVLELGDDTLIADTLLNIVAIKLRLGRITTAAFHRQARVTLRAFERERYPFGEADAHHQVALVLRSEGRFAEAVAAHQRAVDIAHTRADAAHESQFRTGLGTTLRLAGDLPAAREVFEESLRLALRTRLPYPIAEARAGLGDCLAGSDRAGARRLWELAREIYAELDAPELAEIEARLGGEDQLRSGAGGETMVG